MRKDLFNDDLKLHFYNQSEKIQKIIQLEVVIKNILLKIGAQFIFLKNTKFIFNIRFITDPFFTNIKIIWATELLTQPTIHKIYIMRPKITLFTK